MNIRSSIIPAFIASLTALVLMPQAHAFTIIYSHDFSGGTGALNGTPVDVGTANWVASDLFRQNGTINPGPGSATLAFTPQDGNLYSLDATLTGVTGAGNDWIALGFANGQSLDTNTASRFITGQVIGTSWMLFRGSNNGNFAFRGLGSGGNGGTTDGQQWVGPLANEGGGDVDLRILLDTTGGPGTWTATWLAKRPTDADYTVVRPATAMLTESMNSVGLAIANPGISGGIQSFSLSIVPEPSTGLLLALAGLGLLGRRRR